MKKVLLGFITLIMSINLTAGDKLYEKAKELAQKYIIVDTHIDLPLRLNNGWEDISKKTASGEYDYIRVLEGGLNVSFMSIYVPPRLQGTPEAKQYADNLISLVEKIAISYPDKFALANSVKDIVGNFEKGLISLPMGMENGAPIENIDLLKFYYDKGIRYVTLTHAKWNNICDSSYDEERKWHGLSPFGKEIIKEMNRIGMIIDISHVTDETFYQVIELSKTPVIASHSSCRFYTPGFERNMDDDMIKTLAKTGGVIQINFGSDFIDEDYITRKKEYRAEVENYIEEHHLDKDNPQVEEFKKNYSEQHPLGYSTVKKVADHIDHVIKLVGVDYVGLGSDFEGVGDTLPDGLKDVSMYPNLIYELLKLGYTENDIQKICSGNLLRVWQQIEDYAAAN
ncbi:MAG: peptidase M19 [Ignavibacteriae bacterium HGW-Ignavibacteriae-2]|jgi:membrane dipeptidase|nr:MAG: peptidase M19 [Ignavibacteriae bacterium HGW-Ignavibacteriae-2]